MGIAAAVATIGGAVYGVYNGERANKQRKAAEETGARNQAKSELAADQALNRANPKRPNTQGMLSALQQSAKGGPSGTMLTGPTGIDPNSLSLGRSTLLGGGT